MRKLTFLIFLAGFLLTLQHAAVAQSFTIEQSPKMVLRVDMEKKVTVKTSAETTFNAAGDIQLSGGDGIIQISSGTLSADKKMIEFMVKGLAPNGFFDLTAKSTIDPDGIKPQTLKVQVLAKLSDANLTLTPGEANISISEGGSKKFTLEPKVNGLELKDSEIKLDAEGNDENIEIGKVRNKEFIIKANKEGELKLKISANGTDIFTPQIKVTDGVEFAKYEGKPIAVRVGKKKDLAEFFGKDWDKLTISVEPAAAVAMLTDGGTKIEGKTVNTTFMKIKLKDSAHPDTKEQQVNISVVAEAQEISFTKLESTMVVNSKYDTTVKLEGGGTILTGAQIEMKSSKGTCIDVTSKGNQTFTITALSAGCTARLTTTAKLEENDVRTKFIDVTVVTIASFKPLKIRLDMLDGQTARDLFGRKANDEYFIAKVRLFNNLKEDDKQAGDSILVYSESLEVKVAVEYRIPGSKVRTAITIHRYDEASKKYVEVEARDEAGNVIYVDENEWNTLDERTARRWFPTMPLTANRKYDPKAPCYVIPQANMFVPYRPLTFDMVSNTQERRNSRSWRNRLLTAVSGLTSFTSFVTTVAVPKSSNDLKPGLDNFRNLIIPNFEKLFPSHNEVERQNITSMVMRPLEEIPFGSDVTRVLFFPKRKIAGVLTNQRNARKTELRISAISITDACADVGIIKKVRNDSEDEDVPVVNNP